MEVALTPLEFARRTRALYPDREALVDGALRLTYQQFFERCDRFSAALQRLGVKAGDRVAYIAPNTHAQLESFYAVPQIGAVLVPINYRLSPDEFVYIINHSGATVVCAHEDYLECLDTIRPQLTGVRHFIALEGQRDGFLDYEALVGEASPDFVKPEIGERDLLTINYTSGTTSRPKGVMITHRNAYMNTVGTLLHLPMRLTDRYLWTLPMFHANGWTFVWTVTAVGGTHVCLRKIEPAKMFDLIRTERVSMLCAAPTVLIAIASAPLEARGQAPRGVRVVTAGAPPAAATIERIEGELGWTITHVYGLTETAPFITVCEPRPEHDALSAGERAIVKARQGVELITSGHLRVVDEQDRDVPRDGATVGEITVRGNVVMEGYYNDPERDGGRPARRLFSQRRCRRRPSGRLRRHPRSAEGRHHQRRREYFIGGSGRRAAPPCRGAGGGGGRHAGREMGRGAACVHRAQAGRTGDRGRAEGLHPRPSRALQVPAQFQFRRRSAKNRDREDSEVRPARAEVGDRGAVDEEEETAEHAEDRRAHRERSF